MPKVSVIIPTHNRAEFLRSAITSVLKQTYQDFEITVVDEASKDNTKEVVSSFGEKRIKYIHHQTSKGDGAARNSGIANSNGDYIAFLDDDDQWLSEKLQLQVGILENSPAHVGAVYAGYFDIDAINAKIFNVWLPDRRGDLSRDIFKENCVCTSSILLRRQCFEKVGLFDESIPYCSDYDMWIRISKKFKFECIRKPLVKRLVHEHNLGSNFKSSIKGKEIVLEKYSQYFGLNSKSYGLRYLALGELYCYDENTTKGREAFVKSIKIYPYEVRCYYYYCLSLLGNTTFRKLKESIWKLLMPLRQRKLRSRLRRMAEQT